MECILLASLKLFPRSDFSLWASVQFTAGVTRFFFCSFQCYGFLKLSR